MFQCENIKPAVRSEGAPAVCATCLAVDRTLFSLQETPQYVNVCNGLTLSIADVVCYECRAILGNFVKFRSRALRAEEFLSSVPIKGHFLQTEALGSSSSIAQSLSTLTQTVISPYDTIYIDGDSVQVKLETLDSEAEVKPDILPYTSTNESVEPLSVPKKRWKRKNGATRKSIADNKFEMGNCEDVKSESEDGDSQQTEDPLITMHFTAKHMELSEVLSHMEKTRNTTRYKRAQYKCHECTQTFTTEPQYRAHRRRHSERRGRFECEVCGQRYKNDSRALKRHVKTHYTRYACRHCPRSCFSYAQMYFHYRHVHDESTPRQCAKCPSAFKSHRELTQHKHRAHGRKYPCPKCERQYATSVGLQRHSLVHDATVPELECNVCHKKYKGECNLKTHVRNVHELKPGDAYCVECNVQFKDPHQYRMHLKTSRHVSSEDYKYECGHCGKRFTQKPTLIQHVEVTHLKLAKYKCDVCDERFHTKRYAVNHARRKHSGEPRRRKHVCHICAKAFAARKSLDEHTNAHLGVRPFACKLCGATFAYNSALYNHNQLVHLKKVRRAKHACPPIT